MRDMVGDVVRLGAQVDGAAEVHFAAGQRRAAGDGGGFARALARFPAQGDDYIVASGEMLALDQDVQADRQAFGACRRGSRLGGGARRAG